MKLIRLITLCLLFLSCKIQKDILLKKVNNNLKNYIVNDMDSDKKKEFERYLNNEIKYVIACRKDFFERLDEKIIQKANLIENVNEFSDRFYSAILQIDNSIYTYENYISKDSSSFNKIDIKTFRDNKIRYSSESCILSKIINDDLSELLDENRTTRFEYHIYITKINDENDIKTMSLNDVCEGNGD